MNDDKSVTSVRYHVVDVFTERAFAGNPLAVVPDGDGMSSSQMQAIANEFNLSETTFVCTPSNEAASYKLRIFTPTTELPFAGHPSVGSAWLLHSLGRIGSGRNVQECGAGLLPIDVTADRVELTGGAPTVGEDLALEPFCEALGLPLDAVVGTPVRCCGAGIDFAYVHVLDSAVAHVSPDHRRIAQLGNAGVSVFSFDPVGNRVHARVFPGGVGVGEDPATGSAALGLGVFLVSSGLLPADGVSSYLVEQGAEVARPSQLHCTVTAKSGRAVQTRVAGSVVPVATGQISVPAF